MFSRLGAAAARHPLFLALLWLVFAGTCAAFALGGVGGASLFDRLTAGEPSVPGSESVAGRDILEAEATRGESITLAVEGLTLDDPEALADVQRGLNAFRSNANALDGVLTVADPFQFPEGLADPAAAPLISTAGDGFIITVTLAADLDDTTRERTHDEAVALLDELPTALGPDATGVVSSSDLIGESIVDQLEADLQRGELLALPLSLLIMVVVFGGFLAAGIPVIGAMASIAGGLGVLYGFSYLLELDSSVVNVVTVMALGLSIDYGLLIVSRFREEAQAVLAGEAAQATRRGRSRGRRDPLVAAALRRTMATAGRTVTFSGLTVAICIAGLMVMKAEILRAVGVAGVSVVVIAVLTALTLVPALIGLLGRRLMKPSLLSRLPGIRAVIRRLGDVPPEHGFFSRLATITQKRPWIVALLSTLVLATLASPLLGVQLRNSSVELIPESSDQRAFLITIDEDYPALVNPPIQVVIDAADATRVSSAISAVDNVTTVDPLTPVGDNYALLGVRIDDDDAGGTVAEGIVRDIRELRNDDAGLGDYWVVGQAASQIDFVDSMAAGAPLAGGLVVLAIFVLLFLMTGSLLVPLKALVINTLSLAAGIGVTAWVFAEGHLEGLLDFTSPGGLESYVIAMAAAFGFGLAMDYEVFLLARIKERYDAGEDNDTAVRNGLQRTGRIITSAALVMIVVFSGFISGELVMIKEVGFALAISVLIDATIVRMLLVPATMTMLGNANWWAPRPLRTLYRRFAISH